MQSLKLFGRFSCLILFIAVLTALLFSVFFGVRGALVGGSIPLLWSGLIAIRSEKMLSKILRVKAKIPKGLSRSLELAVRESKSRYKPRLMVYQDSFPHAFTIRSLGGNGTLILSQGLISLLNEAELRVILKQGLVQLNRPEIVLKGISTVVALKLIRLVPNSWFKFTILDQKLDSKEVNRLTPFSAFYFLLIYPMIQTLLELGDQKYPGYSDHDSAAFQKITHALQIRGSIQPGQSGAVWPLHLFRSV